MLLLGLGPCAIRCWGLSDDGIMRGNWGTYWQWNNQTPGLLALNLKTVLPFGWRTIVSLRIGVAGYCVCVAFVGSKTPASSSVRTMAWKLCP